MWSKIGKEQEAFKKPMTESRRNMNALQCDFGTSWVALLPNSVVNNIDFD